MEKKEINGVWLSYEVEGEGERTLLFLHGNSEDSKIFSKMRKGIVFDGRRVFLDTRERRKQIVL